MDGPWFGLAALCIVVLLCITVLSWNTHAEKTNDAEKFPKQEWIASEGSPVGWPIQIINARYDLIDGSSVPVPRGAVSDVGWGNSRSHMSRASRTVPRSLRILWFSYREKAFWEGVVEFDTRRLTDQFDDDFEDPYLGTATGVSKFLVGMAGEGTIVVWSGGSRRSEVIAVGKAEKIEGLSANEILGKEFRLDDFDAEEYIEETMMYSAEEVTRRGAVVFEDPNYYYDLHNEKYPTKLVIESDYTPYVISNHYFTRENEKFLYEDLHRFSEIKRSLPKEIDADYIFSNMIPYWVIEEINQEEIYAAARKLSPSQQTPLTVRVKVEGSIVQWQFVPRLFIENDQESIEIKGFEYRRINQGEKPLTPQMKRYLNQVGEPAPVRPNKT